MTAKEAFRMIVQDQECPALNWAVEYARAGSTSRWTKEQIAEAREAIKKGGRR